MLKGEVLIGECPAIDRLAARSVEVGKVSSLDHEVLDHSLLVIARWP